MTLTQTIFEPGYDTSQEEQHHQLRSAMRDRLVSFELRQGNSRRGQGSAVALDLGDLLVTDWRCPADLEGIRRGATAAREAEALLLCSVTAGRQVVQTLDETVVLRPGVMLLMSTRIAGKLVVPDSVSKRTIRVPLTALAPYDTGSGVPDLMCIGIATNPLAQLAQGFLHSVEPQLDCMTASDVEGARNALLVLISGLIRSAQTPDVTETDFLPLLRRALENWIVEHLGDGAIRASELATAHNVAPRTVHRAFATTGDTMGSVVRSHRLAAARNDLVLTTLSIAAIAHRWGFCDSSHMGREFRREFRMSPGDYRVAYGIAT